ncbi:MAG: lytic transglycosylase domain-containing protein, partial [Nocardioidaceae bacterium]
PRAGTPSAAPTAPAPEGPAGSLGTRRAPDPGPVTLLAASRRPWPGHPDRRLVRYRVRRGDTATGLAVRFHAWTRELRAVNRLGRHGRLLAGERITIPVVVSRTPRSTGARSSRREARPHARPVRRPWRHADAGRSAVRRVIARTARRHGVDPRTALAIGWQESGWQQRRISSAGAIGAMQVMPGTGRWMSSYAGRRLNLYSLRDNVTAGVLLFQVLRRQAGWRHSIGAYYQGLAAVRRHGFYRDTRRYTRSVRALYRRLDRGWNPA